MMRSQIICIMKQAPCIIEFFIFVFHITSCNRVENSVRPAPVNEKGGYFFTARDGSKIYIQEYIPVVNPANTVYIISGITGINHKSEEEIIDILSSDSNRVVVVHPRGAGYSEGERGDTDPGDIIGDYCEIIKRDSSYSDENEKIFLFGHSMSCAFALEVAVILPGLDGMILVNPPFKLKPAKGMSPGFSDYLKYIGYYIFAPHAPVVNMAGDPSVITDESDRLESELRNKDSLLVKYFSMRCMSESKKIMDAMVRNAQETDFPLLLLYGENDNIVDKSGCDEIYSAWKGKNKSYVIIKGGSHGKSTVVKGAEIIIKWIESI
jgi:alpha-beta hydrolase superfamily lysophospholipase